ncbi:hypothetical protein N8Z18_00040 [bacterium]|nr:hypothetical protein [bacterium]
MSIKKYQIFAVDSGICLGVVSGWDEFQLETNVSEDQLCIEVAFGDPLAVTNAAMVDGQRHIVHSKPPPEVPEGQKLYRTGFELDPEDGKYYYSYAIRDLA